MSRRTAPLFLAASLLLPSAVAAGPLLGTEATVDIQGEGARAELTQQYGPLAEGERAVLRLALPPGTALEGVRVQAGSLDLDHCFTHCLPGESPFGEADGDGVVEVDLPELPSDEFLEVWIRLAQVLDQDRDLQRYRLPVGPSLVVDGLAVGVADDARLELDVAVTRRRAPPVDVQPHPPRLALAGPRRGQPGRAARGRATAAGGGGVHAGAGARAPPAGGPGAALRGRHHRDGLARAGGGSASAPGPAAGPTWRPPSPPKATAATPAESTRSGRSWWWCWPAVPSYGSPRWRWCRRGGWPCGKGACLVARAGLGPIPTSHSRG